MADAIASSTATPSFLATCAAHEVLALRELRQRCVEGAVHSLAGVNAVIDAMVSERAQFIGQGRPDACSDAYEGAHLDRVAAGIERHA